MRTMPLVWIALLLASARLTAWVSMNDAPAAEARAIRTVQSWPVPGSTFSDLVRALTGTQVVLVAGAAFAAFLWWSGARREALTLAVLLILLPLAQSGLKQLVDRPRPDATLARAGFTSPSFPAGHVMSPTVVYGALLYYGITMRTQWPKFGIVLASLAAAILATTGLVNVYLGVHWPTDVLGGYLWGLALLLPALILRARWSRPRSSHLPP